MKVKTYRSATETALNLGHVKHSNVELEQITLKRKAICKDEAVCLHSCEKDVMLK